MKIKPVIYGKKSAFSLAEVLVTLIITGIVAAMTIPNLVTDIQNKDMQVQLKNDYSILGQALKMVTLDNGNVPYKCGYVDEGQMTCNCPPTKTCDSSCYEWTGSSDDDPSGEWVSHLEADPDMPNKLLDECNVFYSEFQKKLRIIKTCSNALIDGCISRYKTQNEMLADLGSYTGLSAKNQLKLSRGCRDQADVFANSNAFVLANGATVLFRPDGVSSIKMFVDVNGRRSPNKWGYDVFQLSIHMKVNTGNLRLEPDGLCTIVEPGGKTATDILNQP